MAFIHCSNWYNYLLRVLLVIIFCIGLHKSLHELIKRKKLQKRGNISDGTVRSLQIKSNTQNNRAQKFYVEYDFKYDQDKAELLVIGYIQSIDNQYEIPTSIQNLILEFYDKYGLQKSISDIHQISKQYYQILTEGDSIEIVYDPIQPKNYNIPMVEYKTRGGIYWIGWMIMTVISGCISILGIKVGCMDDVNNVGLKWGYSILFFIICSMGVWFIVFIFHLCKICCLRLRANDNDDDYAYSNEL